MLRTISDVNTQANNCHNQRHELTVPIETGFNLNFNKVQDKTKESELSE